MPTVTLCLGQDGKLTGLTAGDSKAYAKFKQRLLDLGRGSITFSWKEPRSGAYHRRHFAMLNALYEAQERLGEVDHLRKWLEVGAGYCDFVPARDGQVVAMPKSIAYEKLDQIEFQQIHEAVFKFARSEYARRFLWPHLSDEESWRMVDAVLGEFE